MSGLLSNLVVIWKIERFVVYWLFLEMPAVPFVSGNLKSTDIRGMKLHFCKSLGSKYDGLRCVIYDRRLCQKGNKPREIPLLVTFEST